MVSLLRMIYLVLAVWGALHPMFHLSQWIAANGMDFTQLVDAWRANAANNVLFWELLIASITLSVFVVAEVAVRRNWIGLIAIPVTLFIGLGCGFPLYLFLRTRPVG